MHSFLYFRPEKQEEIDIETPPCLAARFPFDPASVLRQTEYPQNRIREVELKNGIRLVLKPTLEADSTLLITSFAPFGTSSLSDEEYPLLEGFAGYIDMGDIAKSRWTSFVRLPLPERNLTFHGSRKSLAWLHRHVSHCKCS